MKVGSLRTSVLMLVMCCSFTMLAQKNEPEFIGDVHIVKEDNSIIELDKEFADYTSGISFLYNSWCAQALEVPGKTAKVRFPKAGKLQMVVRAPDNNLDPLAVISVYKLRSKGKKRSVVLSENNSWTLMKSRTHSENLVHFNASKYGISSYLITIDGLKVGEYAVSVRNSEGLYTGKSVLACFAIDK